MASEQVKGILFALVKLSEESIGKFQLRLWQAVAIGTPVDLGFARSGWTPTVGTPATQRLDPPKDKAAAKAIASKRYTENQARAIALAKAYKLTNGSVYISNPVPYIVPLNNGSSSQAPARFVERAIEATIRSFDGKLV